MPAGILAALAIVCLVGYAGWQKGQNLLLKAKLKRLEEENRLLADGIIRSD